MKQISLSRFAVLTLGVFVVAAGSAGFAAEPTASYDKSSIQAHIRLDLKDETKQVHFIRDNSDPNVLTKVYELKHADPYTLRGYLRSLIRTRSIDTNNTNVDAIKYSDGSGLLIVSAEDYRFSNDVAGESIDSIIARLDQPGIPYSGGTVKLLYFPKFNTAQSLQEMLYNVGALSGTSIELEGTANSIGVDGQLNSLFIDAQLWSMRSIKEMLKLYDQPAPEVRFSYQLIEIYAENDDKIGVDFQSWKNNDGVDFFSAGGRYRNNWAATFGSGVDRSKWSKTEFFNFNPKWNTKYIDFLTSIGRARVVTSGVIAAKNRTPATISVGSGLFYADVSKTITSTPLNDKIVEDKPKLPTGTDPEGNPVSIGDLYKVEHGKEQNTAVKDGFAFNLVIEPVVTGKSTLLTIGMEGYSLVGWNSDGTPRISNSIAAAEVSIGNNGKDFVVGGVEKTEVVRGVAGVPILKDLPFLGWLFSTESESTKRSQLVLVARAEYARPADAINQETADAIRMVRENVESGVASPVNNIGFEQLLLDTDTIE